MSLFHRDYVSCPYCANEQEMLIWDYVDIGLDPDLKERLLRKEIQSFVCDNCGEDVVLAEPLLYADPGARLLIYYAPQWKLRLDEADATETGRDALRQAMTDVNLPGALQERLSGDAEAGKAWRLRLVGSYNLLIEAVLVRAAGLDDRLMAVLKLALRSRYREDEGIQLDELCFVAATEENLIFQALDHQQGWQSLTTERKLYDRSAAVLASRLEPDGNWETLGENWAARFLQTAAEAFRPQGA